MREGVQALQITSMGIVFWGLGMTANNALNGSGDIRTPTWNNIFCFWMVQIPLAYILSKIIGWEGTGVAIAIACTDCLFFLCGCLILRRCDWFSFNTKNN